MGTEAIWAPLVLGLASAATNKYNTDQTNKRLDNQAALAITNQGKLQKAADQKVDESLAEIEGNTADAARAKRTDDYLAALRRTRGTASGDADALTLGGDAFRTSSATAAQGLAGEAARTAGLMARADAGTLQRQGEATAYGNLGTDIDLLKRRSSGQSWIDDLRARQIRRNSNLDLAAGLLAGASSATAAGGGMGGAGAWGQQSPISGVNTGASPTGWQGDSAFGAYGRY